MLFLKPNVDYTKGVWSSAAFFNAVLLLLKLVCYEVCHFS